MANRIWQEPDQIKVAILIFALGCFIQNRALCKNKVSKWTDDKIQFLNPDFFNTNFNFYDQHTALFCAHLSDLSYKDANVIIDIEKKLRETYSNSNIKLSRIHDKKSNATVLLYGCKTFVVTAFKGTYSAKDALADFKIWTYKNKEETEDKYGHLPAGHGGFRRGIMNLIDSENIFNSLRTFISTYSEDYRQIPVYITGHSLGAGYGTMFFRPLVENHFNFQGQYNFAPPLTLVCNLNDTFFNRYHNLIFDVVNRTDVVARPVLKRMNSCRHIGKFYRICYNNELNKEDEVYYKFLLKEKLFLPHTIIKYHSLKNYIRSLSDTLNTNKLVVQRFGSKQCCFVSRSKSIITCSSDLANDTSINYIKDARVKCVLRRKIKFEH